MQKTEKKERFKERFKVYKDVFEKSTIEALWKLITQGNIEGLESPLKVGKESNIFSAITKENERLAVKIHRIGASDFGKMFYYLSMDNRFKTKRSRRNVVLTWAKREYKNLVKAFEAGVAVPKPIAFYENVIVMDFIGEKNVNEKPIVAPLLKDFCEKPKEIFAQLLLELNTLYNKADLVHGDLSEYNILNFYGKPILIDLSHATTPNGSGSELFLRDVKNLCRFFNRFGLNLKENDVALKITKKQ